MLWAMLAGSVLFTTYTLLPDRASAPAAPRAAAAPPPPTAVGGAAPETATAVPAAPPLSEDTWREWRARSLASPRDPFYTQAELEAMNRPPAQASAALPEEPRPEYPLRMVITAGAEHRALVGDRLVKVGDMLGDERVVQIAPDGVVLDRRGARRRLTQAASTAANVIRLESAP